MSCFFAHVLMSFAYVCFYFIGGETPIPMQYIMDLQSFSGPICLFVTRYELLLLSKTYYAVTTAGIFVCGLARPSVLATSDSTNLMVCVVGKPRLSWAPVASNSTIQASNASS